MWAKIKAAFKKLAANDTVERVFWTAAQALTGWVTAVNLPISDPQMKAVVAMAVAALAAWVKAQAKKYLENRRANQ